jgi:hypothetical protein
VCGSATSGGERAARRRAGVAVGLMVLAWAVVCSSALPAKGRAADRVPASVATAQEDSFARYLAPLLVFDSSEDYHRPQAVTA